MARFAHGRRALPVRHGRPAARDVGAFRGLARHWSQPLPLLRLPPQPAAPGGLAGAVKLHTKIIIGLVSGAGVGIVANAFATGADWVAWTGIPAEWAAPRVQWVGDNVAGPVGQI